jgi:transposase
MERPMGNDLSRPRTPLEQDNTLIAVVELSLSSWVVAGIVPEMDRHPLKKLGADNEALLQLIERWRDEAMPCLPPSGPGPFCGRRTPKSGLGVHGLKVCRRSKRAASGKDYRLLTQIRNESDQPARLIRRHNRRRCSARIGQPFLLVSDFTDASDPVLAAAPLPPALASS